MASTLERPPKQATDIKKVAILFAGGPAPAANAVISTAAVSFVRNDIEVLGIKHGYSNLINYSPDKPLTEGDAYIKLDDDAIARTRNRPGIIIGTARSNPGKQISSPSDLANEELAAPMKRVYDGLCSLDVDALISIGGDDTLKTANKFKMFQDLLPAGSKKLPVIHLPKTIDNDYMGIDFTFGYFTAVEFLSSEIHNLLYDAQATQSYYLTECMGRSAGWLAFGAAICGEASFVVSVEDITGEYRSTETVENPKTKQMETRDIMDVDMVVGRMIKTIEAREKEGKDFGVIVIAEGLAEFLPNKYLEGIPRDDHGHISITQVNLCKMFSKLIADAYEAKMGKKKKVTGLQLGYEARCAQPHAFDVMLGSQLGVGAYRALVERKLNGVMVSVEGQLALRFVPFEELVDPATLVTKVRFIDPSSDFHRLARFLETDVNE